MSETITYIDSRGIERYIVNGTHVYLLGEDGFGLEGLNVIDERTPFRHGATRRGTYLPPREMMIKVGIVGSSYSDWKAKENALLTALNPLLDDEFGTLHRVTADGRTRRISCCLTKFSKATVETVGPCYSERMLGFYASDPTFWDPTQESEAIAVPIGTGLSFPLTFPMSYGSATLGGGGLSFPLSFPMSFPTSRIDGRVSVYNSGDVDTWPVIRITGPCDNPYIENETTGKSIKVTQLQDAGDYIEIDMNEGTVGWYDATTGLVTNEIEDMTAASEFWPLAVGENSIRVIGDNASGATITVSWYNRYLSV